VVVVVVMVVEGGLRREGGGPAWQYRQTIYIRVKADWSQ
jgi:hypothetical protein